jgi:hypothetical protein
MAQEVWHKSFGIYGLCKSKMALQRRKILKHNGDIETKRRQVPPDPKEIFSRQLALNIKAHTEILLHGPLRPRQVIHSFCLCRYQSLMGKKSCG